MKEFVSVLQPTLEQRRHQALMNENTFPEHLNTQFSRKEHGRLNEKANTIYYSSVCGKSYYFSIIGTSVSVSIFSSNIVIAEGL